MGYNISIFLDKRRSKLNGLYPIKLRVYSAATQKKKLYPLGIDLSEKDFENIWNSNKRLRGANEDIRIKLQSYVSRAHDEADKLSAFDFEKFERKMFRKTSDGDNVFFYYEKTIESFIRKKKVGSADSYNCSLNSIKKFTIHKFGFKLEKLSFSDITPDFLEDYEDYMLGLGKSITTVGIYLRPLRAIFNTAISDNDIHPDIYPFGKRKYQIPQGKKVKKALSQQELSILFNAKSRIKEQAKARDFWFFSYACNGMNMKDIALLKYTDFDGDAFYYYRAKTFKNSKQKQKIKIYTTPFTREVINKYGNSDKSSYVFSILEDKITATEQHKRIKNFTRLVNQHVRNLAKENGLPGEISTYWARHSFATNAVRKGASMEFISEALNHSDLKVTKGYFAGFEDEAKKEFAQNLMDF